MSKVKDSIKDYFQQSSTVIASLSSELDSIEKIAIAIYDSNAKGGKVLIAGNGGSCADSEHFAGELLCTFKARDRGPIGAIHLANNSSAITAWTNDFEFNSYFTRQVEALGNKGDILFLITTGGGDRENGASMNLVFAAEKAKELGLVDGLGNANEVLKEKFGEDVVIKKFEKSKGWLSKKLSSSSNQMDQMANILEERSIWQRYGF